MQLEESVTLFDDNKVENRFAELQITADGIASEVSRKVGDDEVISRINQTAESVKIHANKIQIDGVITAINDNTTTTIDGDKITTGTLSAGALIADEVKSQIVQTTELSADKITSGDILASRMSTNLISAFQAVVSDLKALAATIGGFFIGDTDIHTKDVPITSNADNSVGLSSSVFTRMINGTSRSNLKFAIGSKFGVDKSGTLYANGANVTSISADNISTGTLRTNLLNANEIKSQIVQTTELSADKIVSGTIKASLIDAIGASSGAHASLTPTGLDISNGDASLASFGTGGMRIGKDGEKHIEVKSNAFNVFDEDGSVPFSVSTEGSLKSAQRSSSSAMTASSGGYPSWNWTISLNGTITDNRIYFGVSTSGFPTSYTNYITLPSNPTTFPTTLQSITVSGVTCSARWQTRSTIYVQFQNTTSSRIYAGYRCTDTYYETTVKVNDANFKIEPSMALLKDVTGASVDSFCYIRTYGHIAMLSVAVYNTRSISAGGIIYSGNLASFLPVIPARLVGTYQESKPVVGTISSGGTITLYNMTGASITTSSSSPITLLATYIFQ